MKKINKRKLVITIICIIIFVLIVTTAMKIPIVKQLINLVFISFILAYILRPMYMFLIGKGINKKLASSLIIVGLVGFVVLLFMLLIPALFSESLNMDKSINDLENYLTNLNMKIKVLNKNKIMNNILNIINHKANGQIVVIFDKILNSIMNLGENIITYTVAPLIIYYFLWDSENMINKSLIIFAPESRNVIKKII